MQTNCKTNKHYKNRASATSKWTGGKYIITLLSQTQQRTNKKWHAFLHKRTHITVQIHTGHLFIICIRNFNDILHFMHLQHFSFKFGTVKMEIKREVEAMYYRTYWLLLASATMQCNLINPPIVNSGSPIKDRACILKTISKNLDSVDRLRISKSIVSYLALCVLG